MRLGAWQRTGTDCAERTLVNCETLLANAAKAVGDLGRRRMHIANAQRSAP